MSGRSEWWLHFKKCDEKKVECKYCKIQLKSCGNTTNMKQHFLRKHPLIISVSKEKGAGSNKKIVDKNKSSFFKTHNLYKDVEKEEEERDLERDDQSSTTSIISSTSKFVQPKFDDYILSIKDLQEGGVKAGKVTNAIFYMLVKDDMPLSTVEKTGFKYLMKTLLPLYKVPSRSVISQMVNEKYEILSKLVKDKLKLISTISLTTDVWTETLNTTSYLGITGHFIDIKEKQMRSLVLSVKELNEAHNSEYLATVIKNVCSEWNIPLDKVICVTTDNAPNIVKAVVDIFGREKHLGCFAHTINLVANKPLHEKDGVQEVRKLLNHVKNIVSYFKHCVNASDDLKKIQEGSESLKLIQSVCTRWNSIYYQLERFLKLSSYVAQILLKYPNAPPMLSATQIKIVEDLVKVFEPFETVTKELSGEKYTTIGLVIPLINCLKKKLEKIDPLTEIGLKCKLICLESIESKFSSIEKNRILAIGTLLDPRFKKIHFNNIILCSQMVQKLTQLLGTCNENIRSQGDEIAKSSSHSNSFWEFHAQLAEENLLKSNTYSCDENNIELKSFLSKPVVPIDTNVIVYWCDQCTGISNLQDIALSYMTIMATSVPCERVFSLAGNIMTENRNRLKKLNELLFLKSLDFKDWLL